MRLYLPSLVAFAAELGTGLRHAVQPQVTRPERALTAGSWVIPAR